MKVLCVAEKPSIAKAVANHLGSRVTAVRRNTLSKNCETRTKELTGSRIVFVAYNGSRITDLTFAFNSGGSAMLLSHALLVISWPTNLLNGTGSGTHAHLQISLMLPYRVVLPRYVNSLLIISDHCVTRPSAANEHVGQEGCGKQHRVTS